MDEVIIATPPHPPINKNKKQQKQNKKTQQQQDGNKGRIVLLYRIHMFSVKAFYWFLGDNC